ncbi:hypothetical protein GCM10010174_15430 [Kutzneria viridogrisea]|uniref:Peptidase S8/S53 domain-containing protein n=2 Tax=Kutzneria TaxID=43356 RepID=W5WJT2_9PSEU|nr:S8 family peptidase [Kutzneria albida]AHI00832.1 hypothetical protein KALB_7474 [Kutzneria albida DSM 43870]MBA8926109.1 subtilisin family serine protease [Kutzneria viridogrisea]
MTSRKLLAAVCGALAVALLAPSAQATTAEDTDVYLVRLRDHTATEQAVSTAAKALVDKYGGTLRKLYYSAIQGFSVSLTPAQKSAVLRDPGISSIALNRTFKAAGTQRNPPSWGLDRIDQHAQPLDHSYTYPNKAENVHVYVFDTGIRTSHSEFGGRAHAAFDAVDATDHSGTDCNGHGTEVAGAIGGSGVGVAKGVQLESVRVLGCDGTGSAENVMTAVDWLARNAKKPAFANLSFSGASQSIMDLQLYNLNEMGIGYSAAAGNGDDTGAAQDACDVSPGRQTHAVTVGATDKADKRLASSNVGSCVHLFAPGKDIVTASAGCDYGRTTVSGTSIAAAEAAGAAALYLSAHPQATAFDVEKALSDAATPDLVGDPGTDSPNKLLYVG